MADGQLAAMGFYSRIDPVGTGSSLRFFQGNNSGGHEPLRQ